MKKSRKRIEIIIDLIIIFCVFIFIIFFTDILKTEKLIGTDKEIDIISEKDTEVIIAKEIRSYIASNKGISEVKFYENLDSFTVSFEFKNYNDVIVYRESVTIENIEKDKTYQFVATCPSYEPNLITNLEFEYYIYSNVYFWE